MCCSTLHVVSYRVVLRIIIAGDWLPLSWRSCAYCNDSDQTLAVCSERGRSVSPAASPAANGKGIQHSGMMQSIYLATWQPFATFARLIVRSVVVTLPSVLPFDLVRRVLQTHLGIETETDLSVLVPGNTPSALPIVSKQISSTESPGLTSSLLTAGLASSSSCRLCLMLQTCTDLRSQTCTRPHAHPSFSRTALYRPQMHSPC